MSLLGKYGTEPAPYMVSAADYYSWLPLSLVGIGENSDPSHLARIPASKLLDK